MNVISYPSAANKLLLSLKNPIFLSIQLIIVLSILGYTNFESLKSAFAGGNGLNENSFMLSSDEEIAKDENYQLVQEYEQLYKDYLSCEEKDKDHFRAKLEAQRMNTIHALKALSGKNKNGQEKESMLNFMMPSGNCPEIQVIELLDIPGFAQTDELVVCGDPDTLSFLIYIEEPGTIGGTQMTIDFEPGMQYAGFELTHYADTTAISVVDPTPGKPRFLLDGITNGVYVAYIGVETTCDADIVGFEYEVDLKFNFIFEDTMGNFYSCTQNNTPARTYNSTIKKPALNFQNNPVTTLTSLETEYCTDVRISQDGIGAYVDEIDFSICDIDLTGELNLNSINIGGTSIPFVYNSGDSTVMLTIDNSHFTGGKLDESEILTVQVCYQSDDCPTVPTQLINYKASFGCAGDICEEIVKASQVRVRPNVRPEAFATLTKLSNPGVCGDAADLELELYAVDFGTTNPVGDAKNGLFTDLTVGFEACATSSLEITEVIMGGNSLDLSAVSWVNDDLVIDFTGQTSDPDGPGGITDFDGDGFYDDLPGDQQLNMSFKLAFVCTAPDPVTASCGSVDCSFASVVIRAKRDCGQSFVNRPSVSAFNIVNGATSVGFEGQTNITTSLIGYNFGATGETCGGSLAAPVRTVEFCYVYERENVDPCPDASTTNELQVVFSGSPILVYDLEFVAGSGEITIDGVPDGAPGATGTFTDVSTDTRILTLPIGSNAVGQEVCYKYQIQADSTRCSPQVYMFGTHQVVEKCDTGACTCEIIKACDKSIFRSDPRDCACACDISTGGIASRINYGYTDSTMTTKATAADITDPSDLNRYLVCDTMLFDAFFVPNTSLVIDDPYQWYFYLTIASTATNIAGTYDRPSAAIDAAGSEILGLSYSKVGSGGARTDIDLTAYGSCIYTPPGTSSGLYTHNRLTKTPWQDIDQNINCNSGTEYYDNSVVGIVLRNLDDREDCDGVERASWQEDSDCLREMLDDINFELGDTLWMSTKLALTRNIAANSRKSIGDLASLNDPQIVSWGGGNYFDEFDSDCVVGLTNCRTGWPFLFDAPDGMRAITNYSIDDCGGSVEHVFNVTQTTNPSWYKDEYRP